MNVQALCNVCLNTFNSTNHKPLVLQCGHTYCLACLKDIEAAGKKLCPSCREEWRGESNELPISYMLIPGAKTAPKSSGDDTDYKSDYNMCLLHSCTIEHWCCKCQVATCKKCISEMHYAHGQVAFENVVGQEIDMKQIKKSFNGNLGKKFKEGLKNSVSVCNEGLELIESMKEIETKLLSWKKHLLAQEKNLSACMEHVENTSEAGLKAKFDAFLKIMSSCDVGKASLSSEWQLILMKFEDLGGELQSLYKDLEAEKRRLLPEELQTLTENVVIKGERMSKKIVRAQPTIPAGAKATVTVVSSVEDPIISLQDLLLYLMNGRTAIHLRLLDSFFNGNSSSANDSLRLKHFLCKNFGAHLASFYGHLTHAAWAKFGVVGLLKLGLHLQSGADVADVNKILNDNCGAGNIKPGEHSSVDGTSVPVCRKLFIADIAINKSIKAKDIWGCLKPKTNMLYRLHLVKLEDGDWKRCSGVVTRLLPGTAKGKRNHELWIHDCSGLSADVTVQVAKYLCQYTSIGTLRMNNHNYHSIEEAEEVQLDAYFSGCALHFSIPSL
ncbi:tripartite motif-containing protein 2-like isoform X2 [Hyalella azteca]|nr:tripartite motif-containing protein 2-like isoform X2 [Hyalella azteca]XP_018021320.1 tripartite motif-containing protein 2-like isoform X2 [Hyalella azteca]XP_047736484.1 tripartite motif-containing protein 2-like isoform X2 [Hyalella azteca]